MVNQIKGPLTLDEYMSYREDGLIPQSEIDYQIEHSVVLNGSTDYFAYTPATPSASDKKWFLNVKLERTRQGTDERFYAVWDGVNGGQELVKFNSDDTIFIQVASPTSNVTAYGFTTNRKFRDVGFYDILVIVDTTHPIQEDRLQLWVNSERVYFSSAINIPVNQDIVTGTLNSHRLGVDTNPSNHTSCYMSSVILGIGVTPPNGVDDFGVWDFNDWKPKEYTGPIGTGSYLKFHDNTNLGKAFRGADWVVNGTPKQSKNTPTRRYCLWNIIDHRTTANLAQNASEATAVNAGAVGAIYKSSGIHVVEFAVAPGNSADCRIGLCTPNNANLSLNQLVYNRNGVVIRDGVSLGTFGSGFTIDSSVTLTYDIDLGVIEIYRDGTFEFRLGDLNLSGEQWAPMFFASGTTNLSWCKLESYPGSISSIGVLNRAAPLNTSSSFTTTETDNLSKHFVQGTYVGNSTSQTITFKDHYGNLVDWGNDDYLLINKNTGNVTTNARDWHWHDTVMGITNVLVSNSSGIVVNDPTSISSSDGTGFTVGSNPATNENADTIAYWALRAGTQVVNNEGTIPSLVSVNREFGFAIVTITANSGVIGTVGHDLGDDIGLIIGKSLGPTGRSWTCYHHALGATEYILMNSSGASVPLSTVWNDTEPTKSVFTLGTDPNLNSGTETIVFYVFAKNSPFIKCFSVSGNSNADGPLVNTDFEPRFSVLKRSDAASTVLGWRVQDAARGAENPINRLLGFESSAAEIVSSQTADFNGNSWKYRSPDADSNAGTIIGLAIGQPTVLKRAK